MKTLKLLVYADVNLNIMDGSSVWLVGLLQLLASDPRVQLEFLLKAPDQGGPLNENLRSISNIKKYELHSGPMKPDQAVCSIKELNHKNHYDRVLVRGNIAMGQQLVKTLQGRLVYYTLEPFQLMKELTSSDKVSIGRMLNSTAFVIVQSERMRTSYSENFNVPEDQIFILPPLMPPVVENPGFRNRFNTLCYTGKFSEEWGTPDLVDTFTRLKELLPYARLSIAGNKFHGDLGKRKDEICDFFINEERVNWIGEVSRQDSIQLSRNSDIGFALRSSEIDNDNSQELSTKLFEYMSAGKPVILRPTTVHKVLLGDDYPLFANTSDEAANRCLEVLTRVTLYEKASKMAYRAYKRFARNVNHEVIIERLLSHKTSTILFAGHDLKFAKDIIQSFEQDDNYSVLTDQWQGHTQHNEDESLEKLEQADVIFCEWGLGNIRWYSKYKKAGQRLLVRVHRQEVQRLDYLRDSVAENIDKYIFIAPYRYEEFVEKVGIPRQKAKLIFNNVDTERFTDKYRSSDGFTLGLVGIVPWGKRLDKAVGLFEQLWKKDKRYKLRVKGKRPEDFPWMFNQSHHDEMQRYKELFELIDKAPWRNNVLFDPHGNDMPSWYKKVDYILSVSDYEGSHQAVAEGMASGCIPLIRNWKGASTVYPSKYVFNSIEEMIEFIFSEKKPSREELVSYVKENFDSKVIYSQIRKICEGG